MSEILFGPAGLGPVSSALNVLDEFHNAGIMACEIAFTYGVYIKPSEAIIIGKKARELNIALSIHAPYYLNLNSKDKTKIHLSKERIINCCEIAHYLGAKNVVFHAGFYSEMNKEETYQNIKKEIQNLLKTVTEKGWTVELCPELMGKNNVFGSIEEISRLVNDTGCNFCIDFAHVLARYKKHEFDLIKKHFPQKKWHCHFSGIIYEEKGEKKHRDTTREEWTELLAFLKKLDKEIVIISEAPNPLEDAANGKVIWDKTTGS
jgi:deoxyribonuclease-4